MEEQTETEAKNKGGRQPKPKATDWSKRERRRADLSVEAQLNLKAPTRPGFIRRWVSDTHGRVERFRGMDYEPVLDEDGSQISSVVGKHTDGRRAILMETPEDWYKEAQEKKAESIPDPKRMRETQAGDGEYIVQQPGKPRRDSALSDDKLR